MKGVSRHIGRRLGREIIRMKEDITIKDFIQKDEFSVLTAKRKGRTVKLMKKRGVGRRPVFGTEL